MEEAFGRLIERAFEKAEPQGVTQLIRQARDSMLRSLFDLLKIDDPHKVDYLTPLVETARDRGALVVATLNYDRSVENAAELVGIPCDTGIETWSSQGQLEWSGSGLRLLKLHGSIDWVVERTSLSAGQLPRVQIRKVAEEEKDRYERPAVVFGEAGKLRSEGPYLELLLTWANALKEAENLLVIGYSFRDDHVNEFISRWFNDDPAHRIVVVDPEPLASKPFRSFAQELSRVNEPRPGAEPAESPTRVVQIQETTKGGLKAGIEASLSLGLSSEELAGRRLHASPYNGL